MADNNVVLNKENLKLLVNLLPYYNAGSIIPMMPEYLFYSCSSMSFYTGQENNGSMPNVNVISSVNATINEDIVNFPFVNGSVKTLSLPNCKFLNGFVGYCSGDGTNFNPLYTQVSLSSISLPECVYITQFYIDTYPTDAMTSLNLPKCKVFIGAKSYYYSSGYTKISSISLPECRFISGEPFIGFSYLSRIELPKCETIFESRIFDWNTYDLISLPKLQFCIPSLYVSTNTLYIGGMRQFNSATFSALGYVSNLILPDAEYFYYNSYFGLSNANNGMTISLPKCIDFTFTGTSVSHFIKSLSLPNCKQFNLGGARICGNISLPNVELIGGLNSCYSFNNYSLYLMGSKVAELAYSFGSSTSYVPKSIIVPKSLYTSYKTAAKWSYYSSKIFSA